MLKNILNLQGVTVLSKQQQRNINGGEKCKIVSMSNALFETDGEGTGTYNGGATANTCMVSCRPTILGIGVGSWSEPTAQPC